MNMRKLFSILLAFVLVMGTISPCYPVWGAEALSHDHAAHTQAHGSGEHTHTFGQWTVDTAKGTQSRTCSGCNEVQTLYGTNNKVEQVTAPAIGGNYYLAANVQGELQYFSYGGSVTDTKPYSLHVTTSTEKATQVTLEDPTLANEGTSTGFQLTFPKSSTDATTIRIYCYDVLTTDGNKGVMDTGHNSANYIGRHTFEIAEVSGMKVLRKLSNNNVLVVKYNEAKSAWRMLGVPASELGNEGVYPVMLVNPHTHTYGATYEKDATHHWQVCDCGAQSGKAAHTYGDWIVDTAKGIRYKACTVCERVGDTLYGNETKVSRVTAPTVGSSYYMVANVKGELKFFATGKYTNTTPYSLPVVDNAETASQITLAATAAGNAGEFKITYEGGKAIYCADMLGNDRIMDTSATSVGNKNHDIPAKTTFVMDEVNGVKVIRKTENNNVMVLKKLTLSGESVWRMLGVPEAELANADVYPVMLANLHTHTYGATYEKDATHHWQVCDCGETSAKANHDFTNGACICGAENTAHECKNTDGKWYDGGEKHYQKCGTCGEQINEADHTYGEWIFDTAKGIQYKACTACERAGQTLYGTETKVSQVTAPAVGSEYYLVVNINGQVLSFITGGYTQTTPYSIITSETLNTVTVNAALEAGKGEFQLVNGGEFFVYSVAAGVGLSRSASYVSDPTKVSFSIDEVNGVKVLRAYGTGKILAAKYSDAKSQWRIFPVEDSEIGTEGVFPAMLATLHTHTYGTVYGKDTDGHWQICDCGTASAKVSHDFVNGDCVCGEKNVVHECQSTDGKWFDGGEKHYQKCGTCGEPINEAAHTYGNWIFDAAKGIQYKACTACERVGETLYGTETKVSQVTAPTVGSSYYMVANVKGELKYFVIGKYTSTAPYSLPITESAETASQIKLMATAAGNAGEFKITYNSDGDKAIYCADMLGSDRIMDTSATSVGNKNHDIPAKTTFVMDEVNGVKVIRKTENNNVMVLKKLTLSGESVWRMLGVPEAELANADVYPVMLANLHTHTPKSTFEKDDTQHWHVCSGCDGKVGVTSHTYVKNSEGKHVCECGAVLPPHNCASADGKWFAENGKHYQVCGTCFEQINMGEHTLGAWVFNTEKGTQSKSCSVCSLVCEVLHGTGNKVSQVSDPTIGEKYYLVANVNGQLISVISGGVTETDPYSMRTGTTLAEFTLNAALQAGKGEFQLVDGEGRHIYSIAAGTGLTVSENYITYPEKVSFFMDEVNGVPVIRAYGTNNILVAKFHEATGIWRVWCLPESELANEGVFPVMLATAHEHDLSAGYQKDDHHHWYYCPSCDSKMDVQKHEYVKNGSGRVCICGKKMPAHTCQSTDGKWYSVAGKHYQLCGICSEHVNEGAHTYGTWTFDTAKGTQSATCKVCKLTDTLHGTNNKVYQETDPAIGGSYYLVANVDGKLQSFVLEGSVTDTVPYSLHVTDDLSKENVYKITLEAPVAGAEGFQLTFVRKSDEQLLRIYCFNSESTNPAMDTGLNSTNELSKHTFKVDEVNGVKVLRKLGNNNILVVKYVEAAGTYRMLGVEEAELANEGVYPVMLGTAHTHSLSKSYLHDAKQHWHYCSTCDSKINVENHKFEANADGKRECFCGYTVPNHKCQNEDGKWYSTGGRHYQICSICQDKINVGNHNYGTWTFDTAKGKQSATCKVCKLTGILHGNYEKVYQETDPTIGGSYYLVANMNGKLQFFVLEGSVADTVPYSLHVTDDLSKENVYKITPEAPVAGDEGFQLTFIRKSDEQLLRIYCFNSESTNPAMDTGLNSTNELSKHTFKVDEVNGVKVLRKLVNNNILVVKYMEATGTYRMLGVEEAELANEGVYPVMLAIAHEHTHKNETYLSDNLGHWFACECGGKSNYEDHVVLNWKYTKVPTQTAGGRRTGTCIVCGGKADMELPPMVAEGHYYLTGSLNGKTYYFRDKTAKESVEHTAPFSLMSTTNKKDAMKVNVAWDYKSNTYVLSYTAARTYNIYMADVNGSSAPADGKVDLSASATTVESRILFHWDTEKQMFYQIEGGVRYVMAFKKMTYTDGKTQAVRMLAVPETELSNTVVPVKLQLDHLHKYSDKWQIDAVSHWQECSCGVQKNLGNHTVDNWKVDKKATRSAAGKKSGTCSFCKQKVVNAIPMITDKIKAPTNGNKYYLTGILDGKQYYFRHTPSGGSVANTYPYSLYTDDGSTLATPLRMKVKNGNYNLSYSEGIYLYISGDGMGMTSKVEKKNLVDFQWDDENKVLYQMEGDVKNVMVFTTLRTADGEKMVRITSMPLDRALIDTDVAIVRLTTEAPPEPSDLPADATLLDSVTDSESGEPGTDGEAGFLKEMAKGDGALNKLLIAVAIVLIAVPLILFALAFMKKGAFAAGFFRRRNLWAGISIMAAGLVLAAAMILPGALGNNAPSLRKFTIVASDATMKQAETLAVEIYEDHGYRLPVVHCNDFDGDYGIFLNVTGFNSYGGYKYKISSESNENGARVYIDGSGYSMDTALSKWVKSAKKASRFPFGMEEDLVGYEWNTGDVNMTALGYNLIEMTSRELYEGVEMRELKYDSFAYGQNTGYAIIVDSDADVELKVSAGEWDENTTTDNPGEKFTVQQHGKRLTDAGYDVLAITNAGFYDLNTTMTYIPWGMQIVDGLVKKEPNKDNPKNTDNWFGQTADGKYVISNTDGYPEYETKISDGVGGGLMLMQDGKPCFTGTTPDYRTVVGITTDGDLVMLTISGANYAVVVQSFMDMGLEMDCILNLDGGGSTTLHARTEEGKLEQYICETPVERAVADAIAIVKKK